MPTTNVVLARADSDQEAHTPDATPSTVTARSSAGFTRNLDAPQLAHIPLASAPGVIARFGSTDNLVTPVLEPTIGPPRQRPRVP